MVDKSIWRKYLELMNEIVGGDLRSKSRKSELVLGRALVALQLRRDGYSLNEIGYVINRDHATVVHCIDVAKDRLANTRDIDAHDIWNKFQKEISLQKK